MCTDHMRCNAGDGLQRAAAAHTHTHTHTHCTGVFTIRVCLKCRLYISVYSVKKVIMHTHKTEIQC